MRFELSSVLLTIAALASAQTPDGFNPSVSAHLDVVFGSKSVSPPGLTLTKADTAKQPTIGTTAALNATYIFFMIDLDVPASFTNPNSGPRRTNLHAMISDFKPSGKSPELGVNTLTSSATGPASYMAPAPPAETPPHPHRYVELLYEQPPSFAVPASQRAAVQQKLGFDIVSFAKDASLGAPIAGNYFNVTG